MLKTYIKNILECQMAKKNNEKLCRFRQGTIIDKHCTFQGSNLVDIKSELRNTHMGFGSYISHDCYMSGTKIGNYTCIGPFVKTIDGAHPTSGFVSIYPAFYSTYCCTGLCFTNKQLFDEYKFADKNKKHTVVIGNDVWIGAGAMILQGVTIGDGSIVAAGSVVTEDIQPFTIVGGVPAKYIKSRFNKEEVEKLQSIKWWEWSPQKIQKHANKFVDINDFIKEDMCDVQ